MDIESRLDRMESRALLRELLTAYCIAADDRDVNGLCHLFTDDIHIASADGKMSSRGLVDVRAMFDQMFMIRGPSCHWTHDVILTFDPSDADRVEGLVLAHAETTPDGRACVAAIRYRDTYRRDAGIWKFRERLLSFLYYMPIADYPAHFPTVLRIGIHGGWAPADYPETLDSWKQWHAHHGPGTQVR